MDQKDLEKMAEDLKAKVEAKVSEITRKMILSAIVGFAVGVILTGVAWRLY